MLHYCGAAEFVIWIILYIPVPWELGGFIVNSFILSLRAENKLNHCARSGSFQLKLQYCCFHLQSSLMFAGFRFHNRAPL